MGSKTDTIKGRVKEALGVLTDNDNLKRAGQRDQALGAVKESAAKVKDTAERLVEKAKDKGKRAVAKVKTEGVLP